MIIAWLQGLCLHWMDHPAAGAKVQCCCHCRRAAVAAAVKIVSCVLLGSSIDGEVGSSTIQPIHPNYEPEGPGLETASPDKVKHAVVAGRPFSLLPCTSTVTTATDRLMKLLSSVYGSTAVRW